MIHPATIEFIERCGEILKNFGAAFVRWATRLKTEPEPPSKLSAEAEAAKISPDQRAIVRAIKNADKN